MYYVLVMTPEVEAAIIAAGVGILTFLGAVYGSRKTSQDTKDALNEQLAQQRKQLAETLQAQSDQLDRTLAEQRTRTLNERFATAASQLGEDKPAAVRLAGVYAMAGLADDWQESRQTCIDVLCGFLRMPYEPALGSEVPLADWLVFSAGREVRHTVIRVITAHLRGGAEPSWQGLKFDFRGVVFDGADFAGATFSGGMADFTGASFSSGTTDFTDATFSGGMVDFTSATFSGGRVDFTGATFSGGKVYFGATFSGGAVKFAYATFCGADVGFRDSIVSGGTIDFEGATVTKSSAFSGKVWFGHSTFSGGRISFARITLSGGALGFRGAAFSGTVLDFTGAKFAGGLADFSSVTEWSHPPRFDFDLAHSPFEVKLPAEVQGETRKAR